MAKRKSTEKMIRLELDLTPSESLALTRFGLIIDSRPLEPDTAIVFIPIDQYRLIQGAAEALREGVIRVTGVGVEKLLVEDMERQRIDDQRKFEKGGRV